MRRTLMVLIALLFTLPLVAADPPEHGSSLTPDKLWEVLQTGNKQFVAGSIHYDKLNEERGVLKEHQLPPVTVLSCSDSRVPPELIFNQSLGALFVVRTAGNTADEFGIASIEYAIAHGYTHLIVVLGHQSCGAVSAALEGADPGTAALQALVKRIRSSFAGVPYDSRDAANVRKAVEANARAATAELLANSQLIRDAVITGKIRVVTAYYDLGTGEVKAVQ